MNLFGTHRALLVLLAAAALTACAAKPRAAGPTPTEVRSGVEVTWWVVDDAPSESGMPLRDTLASLSARPVPVPPETLASLKASGLRVLGVSPAEIDLLRSRLHLVGPLQTQWVGESPAWVDLAKSATANGGMTVVLDSGPAMFRDGRLGLAMRTWIAPDPAPGAPGAAAFPAVVVMEVAPRHVPWRAPPQGVPVIPGDEPARPEPLIFERLGISMVMRAGDALLILPESPDEQWAAPPTPAPASSIPHIGPEVPALPTLGEALLIDPVASSGRRARIMILIRSSVTERYELLPRAAR